MWNVHLTGKLLFYLASLPLEKQAFPILSPPALGERMSSSLGVVRGELGIPQGMLKRTRTWEEPVLGERARGMLGEIRGVLSKVMT